MATTTELELIQNRAEMIEASILAQEDIEDDLESQEAQLPICPACSMWIEVDCHGIGFCACCKEFRAPYMEVAS